MDQTAKDIIFKGHVQGVGFRYATHNIARRYDVCGFVRNLSNGTVELFVQGPGQDVENCVADIQESFSGHLRGTEVTTVSCNPACTDFRITF